MSGGEWPLEGQEDPFPEGMGRAGGADLAEIRCVDDVHVGCVHDPDRVDSAPYPPEVKR